MSGATLAGMNCSRPWFSLLGAAKGVEDALLDTVAQFAGHAATCPRKNFTVPPASSCRDAPSFGTIDGTPTTCSALVGFIVKSTPGASAFQLCDSWFSVHTLRQVVCVKG